MLTLILALTVSQCPPGGCPVAYYPAPAVQYAQPVVYYPPVVYYQQPAPLPQAAPQAVAQAVPAARAAVSMAGGDAAGFLAWLNATRASYGLGAVAWDDAVAADCHQNNLHQAAKGMNHWHMGCHRRQNAAWNAGFPGVESMWMNSPGHRSALLDPSISRVAIAWYGAYATFGAY